MDQHHHHGPPHHLLAHLAVRQGQREDMKRFIKAKRIPRKKRHPLIGLLILVLGAAATIGIFILGYYLVMAILRFFFGPSIQP
jgi:hypothetical protein